MDEHRRLQPDIIYRRSSSTDMTLPTFPVMFPSLGFLASRLFFSSVSRISSLCNLVSGFIVLSCFAVLEITHSSLPPRITPDLTCMRLARTYPMSMSIRSVSLSTTSPSRSLLFRLGPYLSLFPHLLSVLFSYLLRFVLPVA